MMLKLNIVILMLCLAVLVGGVQAQDNTVGDPLLPPRRE